MFKRLLNNPITHLTSVMWRYSEGNRRIVVFYSVLAGLSVAASLSGPLVMARLMDAVENLHGDALISESTYYTLLYVLVGVSFWIFHGPSRIIEVITAYKVRRAFQLALFRKVTLLPMKWHKGHHSGETIDQVAKASSAVGNFAESGFEVIHIVCRFVGAAGFLTWIMPAAGVTALVFGAIAALVIVLFDRKLVAQWTTQNKLLNEVAASVQDYLTNVGTVISLRLEESAAKAVDRRADKVLPIWKVSTITNELKWASSSILIDIMHGTVLLGFIVTTVKAGRALEIGAVYALSEYLRSIADAFFRFTYKYGDLLSKSTQVHAIGHIERAYDDEVKASEGAKLSIQWKKIEISDLTFSHVEDADDKRVVGVHNLSLTLERGKSYALVGESGSGKSTLLKLLRGLHHPQSERVTCDGSELAFGLSHVAHHTTLIPQEPEIFAETIRFNVAMGVETSDEEIMKSLELARFLPVLKMLPKGLDTHIAEKGVSLSGGQKQRLALARGLFFVKESDSQIILLDEPTSSLDSRNEHLIYREALATYRDRCVVMTTHRLSLLHLFDEVLVFAHGEIVERGSVHELMAQNGEFTKLLGTLSDEEPQAMTG